MKELSPLKLLRLRSLGCWVWSTNAKLKTPPQVIPTQHQHTHIHTMKENSSAQPPHRLTMLGFGMYKVVHGTGTELVSKGYPKKAKHRAAMEEDLLGRLKVLSVSERSGESLGIQRSRNSVGQEPDSGHASEWPLCTVGSLLPLRPALPRAVAGWWAA